jgi:hypothetical protein
VIYHLVAIPGQVQNKRQFKRTTYVDGGCWAIT